MKKLALLIALSLICVNAQAATTAPAPAKPTTTPAQAKQQNKMKNCAAQYHQKGIAKSQYHSFMSQCLKSHPTTAQSKPDQPEPPTQTASTIKKPKPSTIQPATPAAAPVPAAPANDTDMKP